MHANEKNNQPPLYLLLASMSRYRAQCLSKYPIEFSQWSPNIDESPFKNETPEALVLRLAHVKADAGLQWIAALARKQKSSPVYSHVLGSDQVMVLGDVMIGKPHTHGKAIAQLQAMSGQLVRFYTSLCVLNRAGEFKTGIEITEVQFRELDDSHIIQYLQLEQPFDCAGSFKSEAGGVGLCHSITGRDPNALVGLPMILLSDLLLEFGYSVFG